MKLRRTSLRVPGASPWRSVTRKSALQPLVLVLTLLNATLFLVLYNNLGEGRPLFASYLARNTTYRLSDLYLFQKVATQVERDYVDKERVQPDAMFQASLEQIERDIPEVLFQFDPDSGRVDTTVDTAHKTIGVGKIETLSDVVSGLRSVLEFVEQHLYSDMPMQEVEYAAINGFLSTLDPHSFLLPPEMAREMDAEIQGEFGGLGITISLRGDDRILTIISILPETPAARSGLKPGDRILQVEDESTINMSLDEAVTKLRGPVNTPVTLLVERATWDRPQSITVVRDIIRVHSVAYQLLEGDVGYVWIKAFQHNTSKDLSDALDTLATQSGDGLQGLIIDLRGNPGGPLAQAIEVADSFLDHGTIVSTVRGRGGQVEDEAARTRGTQPAYPMAVIVDAGSASASEIVAGALKNQDRAVVVGETSFGKGSVQNLYAYPDDVKLKLTIAKYLTPGHKSIQSRGIVPDIELVPVYLDTDTVKVYTHFPSFREVDLDSHFEGEDDPPEQPLRQIRYLVGVSDDNASQRLDKEKAAKASGDDETGSDDAAETPVPKEPNPWDDFQARFARRLLVAAGRPTRSETLAAAPTFLDGESEAQQARILDKFATLGIDWSPRSGDDPTSLKTSISLSPSDVTAGDAVEVSVSVTNTGDAPAFQVRAATESEVGVLDGLEFLFGHIDPGKTVSQTRSVKVPATLYSLAEPVTVNLYQDVKSRVAQARTPVRVTARPSPQFAYSLVVVDDGSGLSRGNGDGRIQPGEDIDLLLLARNLGATPVAKGFAKLSATSGKYVDVRRGTVSFEEVAAGAWTAGRFSLSVKGSYRKDTIRAEIVFGDSLFAMTPAERVVLPVNEELPPLVAEEPGRVAARGEEPLEVKACADPSCATFVVASEDAVLDVTGKVPGWLRVRVPVGDDGANGWVKLGTVRRVPDFRQASSMEELQPLFHTIPPRVVLDLPDLEVDSGTSEVAISGTVVDDTSIHDFYLFINGHKQVFRVVNQHDWEPAPDGWVRWHFTQRIPLEEGSNLIEVWAQDAEQHQGMDLFQVYRDPAARPAGSVLASSSPSR